MCCPQQRSGNPALPLKTTKNVSCRLQRDKRSFFKTGENAATHSGRNHVLYVQLHTVLHRALSVNFFGAVYEAGSVEITHGTASDHLGPQVRHSLHLVRCNPGRFVHTCRLLLIVRHSSCFKQPSPNEFSLNGCCNLQRQVGQPANLG